jgi:hypothetical protein
VQQLTQTAEGGSIGTTAFREAGITLMVTPRINDDGSLRLQIAPEFSVLAGFQSGQPIIDRRSASTTVHLYDGESVVIGGLLRRNELETQRGVPGLKNLKYFAPLFRNHDTTVGESELLVFVRAEIIGPRPEKEPRNYMAESVLNEAMERIPVAASHPILPHCGDPYCPYHSPPPRWIEHGMLLDGEGYSDPDGIPTDAGPEHLPHPENQPPSVHSPEHANTDGFGSNPVVRTLPAIQTGEGTVRLPGFRVDPPVTDAARMRQMQRYNSIRRLPYISNETDSHLVPASASRAIGQATGPAPNRGGQRSTRIPSQMRFPPPAQATERAPSSNELPRERSLPRTASGWLRRFIR